MEAVAVELRPYAEMNGYKERLVANSGVVGDGAGSGSNLSTAGALNAKLTSLACWLFSKDWA